MFQQAVAIVLESEGVLSNDPRDPGGETKWGIARTRHPELSDAQWAKLTRADAITIYKTQYWDTCRCGELPWLYALPVFDCAVNQGDGTARRLLQRALKVNDDGVFGPATMAAARQPQHIVLYDFMSRRVKRYTEDANWEVYGHGWTIRLFRLVRLALDLSAQGD